MPGKPIVLLLTILLLAGSAGRGASAGLELKRGDHVCLVGNTLAERMQHDGWLETRLHQRFPEHELVIRNLGFSGDELELRLRSKNFGTPDQWLSGKAPPPRGLFGEPLRARQHTGRRGVRLLRLQRVVRWRSGARAVQTGLG